jgi:hypothetical protein
MLEGEIGQIQLIERLVELWREQFTGAIRFENDGIIKILYFKGGDILSASTNDRSDSIDEILMRAGKVSREHVKQALAKRKENETLGDALLNLGFITRKELTWARRVQVVGVIRSIAAWTDGSFTIVADYLPKRDEGTLFPLPQVLVELIVTEQDRARFERSLDGGNAVFAKSADFPAVWRQLGLNEDAEAITNEVDGSKPAADVATASGRDTFNVYKLLQALATLGILTRVEKPKVTPEFSLDDFATAGVADAADLWNDPTPEPAMDLAIADVSLDDVGPAADVDSSAYVVPEAEPMNFELDEADAFGEPTLDMPARDIPAVEMPDQFSLEPTPHQMADEAPLPVMSAWDETEEQPFGDADAPTPEPAAAPKPMPAWDSPPRDAVSLPIQAAAVPPADPDEEPQWGFDEAQIETARRASVPVAGIGAAPIAASAAASRPLRREKKGGRRYGLVLALLTICILAGAGYFGFLWWQGQQESENVPVVTRRPARRPQPGTAPLATTPPANVSTATSTAPAPAGVVIAPPVTGTASASLPTVITPPPATTTTPTTTPTTTAPAAAPIRITAAAPTTTAAPSDALPRVTARVPAGRERIDAMARDYAANPTGNFTVQIQILCDPSNLEKAMRAGGDRVWFVPQTIGTRSCYRVFWGRFDTRASAQQAMSDVPAALRDPNAAVKAVPRR